MIDIQTNDLVKEKALLVGVYGADVMRWQASEHLDELELLAISAGAVTGGKVLQNRIHPDPATYVGKGKLDELAQMAADRSIDVVIFDDDLSPTQVRNIEKGLKRKILDRSGLILDIFASRAKTAAAKTQVELAQLQYLLPRLTRFWSHLSRQEGGIGTKGPGETQIETDRRLIGRRISQLKEKLEKLDRQRTTQRKGRSGIPRVSLVGYTNAGKSTLMNTLTETSVVAEDRLFATLDATVRRLELDNQAVLVSDTVGFIRKLPHNLIESFKSTLDEVREADILLHVVDATSRTLDEYMTVVEETLDEIGIRNKKTVLVFNKIDRVDPQRLAELKKDAPEAIFVSASRGIGIGKLKEEILNLVRQDYVDFKYKIPLTHYKAAAFLHDVAVIDMEQFESEKVIISGSISRADQKRLESMLTQLSG